VTGSASERSDADAPHSCHRSGHHLDPRPGVRCRSRRRGAGARGIPAAFPGFGLGRTRPRGSVAQHPGDGPGRTRPIRAGTGPDRGHRHHQSARDDPGMGARHRTADPQRHRLAGSPDGRLLPQPARGWPRSGDHRADRSAGRSLFLGDQAALAARHGRRRTRPGGEWRSAVRHGRQLSDLAADRRRGAMSPTPPTPRAPCSTISAGRWSADDVRASGHPDGDAARGADCAAEFGTAEPAHFGAALPICGVAGDQQAATVGQACFARAC
jgi:hypothetical protein